MKIILNALAAAQKEFPAIVKNSTAKMPTYSYKYADLEDVVKGITPTLRKHGLMFVQVGNIIGDRQALHTSVFHVESGEVLGSEFILPNCSDPQDMGIAITYFRRYALCAALGIVTEEDADGATKPKGQDIKAPSATKADDIPAFHLPAPKRKEYAPGDPNGFIVPFGKNKGMTFEQAGRQALAQDRVYWFAKLKEKDEEPGGRLKQYLDEINQYL